MGKQVDERADVYSLGLVVYEMLTGRKALIGSNQAAILQQQLNDAYVPPNQVEQSIPPELNNLVLKLMRSDLQLRYQKADQFLYDLELFESRYKSMAFHSRSVYDFPEFVKEFQEANATFEHKDYDEAHRLASDLARKAPRAAEVFFLLGKIQVERGFVYNAIQEYVKATAFDPDNTYYHMSLGIAYQAIGMREQARAEFEAALKLDPNSRIVRQRLEEADQPAAASGPAEGPAVEERANRPKFLDPDESEKAAKAEEEKKAREPLVVTLRQRRPPARGRIETALRTVAWWGWGFAHIEARSKVWMPTALQAVFVVVGLFLLWKPGALVSLAGSSKSLLAAAEFLMQPGHMFYLILSLYVVATAYFINEASHDAYAMGLVGFIIQERSERQWVTINLGRDRGARVLQIFYIFKEQPAGSGQGTLVGKVLTKEVGDDSCTGPYYPDTRDAPAFGMLAVAQETIRGQLVDPTEPLVGRFPELDVPKIGDDVVGPTSRA